ncbi:MAG: hypothetical protein ACRDQZ_26910 [Mycobacteriales bacterium]
MLAAVQSLLDADALWSLVGFLWHEELPEDLVQRLVAIVLDGLVAQPERSGTDRLGYVRFPSPRGCRSAAYGNTSIRV